MTAPEPTPCTPTDAQVRYAWAYQASPGVRVTRVMSDERDAEFDRWLARVRAEARRDALNEAADWLDEFEGPGGRTSPYDLAGRDIIARLRARAAETPDGGAYVNAPERVSDVIKHRMRGGMTYEAAVASVHDDIATGRATLTQDFRVQYGDKR